MSKIPQGEWSAIAARHAQGESLSAIARSYGCTPPAIHYVLKRNGRQPVEKPERPTEAAHSHPHEPHRVSPRSVAVEWRNQAFTIPGKRTRRRGSREPAPVAIGLHREQAPAAIEPARSEQPHSNPEPHRRPGFSRTTGRALAFIDGLDSELYDRAEVAIETFRSCFDAALAEGSPHDRARLRQAASDLMRVAARTTIVLDRLNALSERAAARFDPRSNKNWPS